MVPGVFTMESPWRAARPERGWTRATYPSGRARAIPVGTSARSPGASTRSTVDIRSAPASPGRAYDGSGSPRSSRTTATGRPSPGARSSVGGTCRTVLPEMVGCARAREPRATCCRDPGVGRPPREAERSVALVGAGHDVGRDVLAGVRGGDAGRGGVVGDGDPAAGDDDVVPGLRLAARGGRGGLAARGPGPDLRGVPGRRRAAGPLGDPPGRRTGGRRARLSAAAPLPQAQRPGDRARRARPRAVLAGQQPPSRTARRRRHCDLHRHLTLAPPGGQEARMPRYPAPMADSAGSGRLWTVFSLVSALVGAALAKKALDTGWK